VRLTYLRYDTAIRAGVDVDADTAALAYEYDDGPGSFSGDARHQFLDWVVSLVRWPQLRAAPATEAPAPVSSVSGSPLQPLQPAAPASVPPEVSYAPQPPPPEVWARPLDAPGPR
jgi:hypothetical protein